MCYNLLRIVEKTNQLVRIITQVVVKICNIWRAGGKWQDTKKPISITYRWVSHVTGKEGPAVHGGHASRPFNRDNTQKTQNKHGKNIRTKEGTWTLCKFNGLLGTKAMKLTRIEKFISILLPFGHIENYGPPSFKFWGGGAGGAPMIKAMSCDFGYLCTIKNTCTACINSIFLCNVLLWLLHSYSGKDFGIFM